jgi:hypothetical protein
MRSAILLIIVIFIVIGLSGPITRLVKRLWRKK